MNAFELDMAFEPKEVAAGLERVFKKLGLAWSCERQASAQYEFHVTLRDGERAQVVVRPLPPERMTYLGAFPRTLLEARADDGSDLEPLRREIVIAFLRVTG
ncbi:MAG: hypothetical protein ACE5I7_09040 [Candidatus Binatia bacterium]